MLTLGVSSCALPATHLLERSGRAVLGIQVSLGALLPCLQCPRLSRRAGRRRQYICTRRAIIRWQCCMPEHAVCAISYGI